MGAVHRSCLGREAVSATNRGATRITNDNYPTPAWCVDRLLEAVDLPRGWWLEPCAGDGAIIRALRDYAPKPYTNIIANDIRDTRVECLAAGAKYAFQCDASRRSGDYDPTPYAVVITNPPYSLALPIIETSLQLSRCVVMLLRLNWLASAKRAAFLQSNPPDIYVLPNRPSFTEDGTTDATDYAWFVWRTQPGRTAGTIQILNNTPAAIRRAHLSPRVKCA